MKKKKTNPEKKRGERKGKQATRHVSATHPPSCVDVDISLSRRD